MRTLLCLAAALLLCAQPALANDSDHQQRNHAKHFTEDERDVIRNYFHEHSGRDMDSGRDCLPPGLAKKGKVPPGWARKGAYRCLPPDLEARLPHVPMEGVVRVIVGADVLLRDVQTGLVLDAVRGVAR